MKSTDLELDSCAVERTETLVGQAERVLAHRRPLGPLEDAITRPDFAIPKLAERGDGYLIHDTLGQTYIDWHQGFGATLLGHRNPAVEAAIEGQLQKGVNLSASSPLEIDTAVALCEMIPSAEMVAFGKNGSDATHAAVRLARAITGREIVFATEYHGFHNWSMALDHGCEGIVGAQRDLIRPIPRNDLDALEAMFREYADQVAALVVDPIRNDLPIDGWFEGLRALTDQYGTMLVFDEVVTGFRFAPGGVQELYGVDPDLTCVAKALANGMPLSALLGKREYMERLPQVYFGMTYRGEALSYASALASLQIFRQEQVHVHVANIGAAVRRDFDALASSHGVPIALAGHAARMQVTCEGMDRISDLGVKRLFVQELVRNGIYTDGLFLPSFPMDSSVVEATGAAVDNAMRVVRLAGDRGSLDGLLAYPATEDCYRCS